MARSKKYLCLIVGLLLTATIPFVALPEEDNGEKIALQEGGTLHLERNGDVALSLEAPVDARRLQTEGDWVKVQITGWVSKSEISAPGSAKEKDGTEGAKTEKERTKPISSGKAGPFHVSIKDVHFSEEVEDRFGTVYRSGAGGSFLAVNLGVRNDRDQGRNLYKSNIVLLDGDGRRYKSVGISNEESFQGGEIEPGETRKGYLFFSVFDDSEPEKIHFEGRPCSSCSKYEEGFGLGGLENDTPDE